MRLRRSVTIGTFLIAILCPLMWEVPTASAAAPTIVSFDPASGGFATQVTIRGTDLVGATAVTFNGVSASFRCCRGDTIRATVPADATSGPIAVTTLEGSAVSATDFVIASPPVITEFTPKCGSPVTIVGTGFTGATRVRFGRDHASFTVTDDSTIVAVVPPDTRGGLGKEGVITVTTPNGTAVAPEPFCAEPPPVPRS
jgi:hypothetical protein